MRVTLFTNIDKGGSITVPGVGKTMIDMEFVAGIQLAKQPPLHFRHGVLKGIGKNQEEMDLPDAMAKRLQDFCEKHYVAQSGDYDCHSLLCHVMGWKGGDVKGRKSIRFEGDTCQPNKLQTGKAYAIIPKSEKVAAPHYMLGIPRKGYSLGVGGLNQPLIIAPNTGLLRAYNGSGILRIDSIEYIRP